MASLVGTVATFCTNDNTSSCATRAPVRKRHHHAMPLARAHGLDETHPEENLDFVIVVVRVAHAVHAL